jgi:hypothetical protein
VARIFLCYRREDTSGHAGRLFDRLIDHFGEKDVFYDVSSIDAGTKWSDMIERQLDDCEVLIAVIGKRWFTEKLSDPKDYVRREIAFAIGRGATVIPVLVDSAELPQRNDLPVDIVGLVEQQGLSLNDKSHEAYLGDVQRLTTVIDDIFRVPVHGEEGERTYYYNRRLEILVETNIVTEKQIPSDSEVVSFGALEMLGIMEHQPRSHNWTWGAIREALRGEGHEAWLDELTQRVYLACVRRVVPPIVNRVKTFDGRRFVPCVNRVRQESEGTASVEILFVEAPGVE